MKAAPALLHITPRADWEAAELTGEYHAASLGTEGFIHLSTPAQVLLPANAFFRGKNDLVLLVIDPARLRHEVRWEEAPGTGQTFPHLYGPLNTSAVMSVVPFPPGPDGTFAALPEEVATLAA